MVRVTSDYALEWRLERATAREMGKRVKGNP